jgi:hypothetical protein
MRKRFARATGLILGAVLFLTTLVSRMQAMAATDMCQDIAHSVRSSLSLSLMGDAEPGVLHAITYKGSNIVRTKWHKASARELDRYGLKDKTDVSIAALDPETTVAAVFNGGTLNCSNYYYYASSGKGVHRLQGLDSTDYVCDGDTASVVHISGTPAIIVETNPYRGDGDLLDVRTWQDHKWGDTCEIVSRFLQGMRFEAKFCRDAACEALAGAAFEYAARYKRDASFRKIGAANPDPSSNALLSLKRPKQMDWFPTLDPNGSFPAIEVTEKVVFPAKVNGVSYLAVVGTGFDRGREYPGYLVSFWKPSRDGFVPVAGFPIETFSSAPLSVTAEVKPTPEKK